MDQAERLTRIFGPQSSGLTPEERARTSPRLFVRGDDQLAFYSAGATGRRLSAWEAFKGFGMSKLEEILDYGSAVIAANKFEPAESIRKKRIDLSLSQQDLANHAKVKISDLQDAEDYKKRADIRTLGRLSKVLQLDDLRLGLIPGGGGDAAFAFRMRQVQSDSRLKANAIMALNEAAWVIGKQWELSDWLSIKQPRRSLAQRGFAEDSRFGDAVTPTWSLGYHLAEQARQNLGIDAKSPILSLRALVEDDLGVPVVQMRLPSYIAGATAEINGRRGIVLNTVGDNSNVFIRRSILAHELGHLLWDPKKEFTSLQLDKYEDFKRPYWEQGYVEARANAFGINFLAPTAAILQKYNTGLSIRAVMEHFGLSYTAAKFHLYNASDKCIPLEGHDVDNVDHTDEWIGRENFMLDQLPDFIPESRRGRFAYLVCKARQSNLMSDDTAEDYLECPKKELDGVMTRVLAAFDGG